ncbi:hypothetical protein JOC75_002897 [Metabacillus crassostreae]|uniref:DUF3021 domain-containing protein n=1 Tax=Metabacillus crassostreae TaxID=929098 RepID=UPI00195E417D|nr:DUF3021 domain-containing protein [Metabacillus crassostreae]MBM7604893.1 hypothetical protein [Metabacillus crassostreae]
MIIEGLRRSFFGLGFSAFFIFIALTIMMLQGIEASVPIIWSNMLGSIVMGIYFGSASLIFDIETWSPLKQTIIHFLFSIMIWLPLAIFIGWLPLEPLPLTLGIGSFVIVYLIFWYGIQMYFKRLEKEMNNSVKKP